MRQLAGAGLALGLAGGLLTAAPAQDSYDAPHLRIERTARPWEFMNAVGPHAAILGKESGHFEAWVYPLGILDDFHLDFTLGGRAMPAHTVVRSVRYQPGSTTLIYSGDYYAQHFRVEQTFVVPREEKGALVRLAIESSAPLEVEARFIPSLKLMWPAGLESDYNGWDEELKAFVMGVERRPWRALVGSPDASLQSRAFASNYNSSRHAAMDLGTFQGSGEVWLVIAADFQGLDSLKETYRRLLQDAAGLLRQTEDFYRNYLRQMVRLELPDARLQAAYEWSMLSMMKGLVENPFMPGRGLVAGFGLSKGAPRPGFAWFFGRDTFWSTMALTAGGDLDTARQAIEFIAHYQRGDGKLPHEIAQSAPFTDWFRDYPYPWASADATQLYILAVLDYVRASGDRRFLSEHWERLESALEFTKSTYDEDGFPRNQEVGHGWIEGGPLLPVRTEFYQAGLGVAALRAMSELALLRGDESKAQEWEEQYQASRVRLEERFWMEERSRYGLAIDGEGELVDEPSILATVPMWFRLTDGRRSSRMITQLASEDHLSDWGSRIISSRSANYGPAGYHFGSVWPLFSGWASLGQYRYQRPQPAYANLMANALIALDGSGGHTTEVVSGAAYSPLSTSSPHQIWSAAMVVSPLLRGLLGLEVDVPRRRIILAPQIPGDWDRFAITNIPLGEGRVDIRFRRDGNGSTLEVVNNSEASLDFDFRPTLAPTVEFEALMEEEEGAPTLQPSVPGPVGNRAGRGRRFHTARQLPPGKTTLKTNYVHDFRYSFPISLPALGMPSSNLKVLSQQWNDDISAFTLTVSGRGGHSYRIDLHGGVPLASVEGAELSHDGKTLTFTLPQGSGYQEHSLTLRR
ncbi:MAG TPA: GH116 family glycosyl hydrolase [Acidobacteriota bacterium]|nr:GH116 family glycosyl hydrolase [Acidobacteriota bacterium]